MPKLHCNAQNCLYHQQHYCTRNRIHVQGVEACSEMETQCGTFKSRQGEDHLFLTEFARFNEANEHLSINCDCVKCKYNYDKLCVKENVNIGGVNAECRQQTLCESFECCNK